MMDDSFRRFNAKVDTAAKQLTLTTMGSGSVTQSPLSYQRPDREHLLIDGMIEGRHDSPGAPIPRSRFVPPAQPRVPLGSGTAVQPVTIAHQPAP